MRQAAPQARIVLAGIPAFRGALPTVEPLISLADLYARLLRPISRQEAASRGRRVRGPGRRDPAAHRPGVDVLSVDRFHPSVVGYRLWADVIFEALVADGLPSGFGHARGIESASA